MSRSIRIAAFLILVPISSAIAAPWEWSGDYIRGLKLDLEACVNGGCLRAREVLGGEAVYLAAGQAAPVRVRLHLDCDLPADVRGISTLARIVLVPAGTRRLECPLEPIDALCFFRFWPGDPRWDDDIVATFVASAPCTPWPAAEDRVDEAEFLLEASAWIRPGEYDLVAALPRELADEYPCEEMRVHPWVETPPLRVVITERSETLDWSAAIPAVIEAGQRQDVLAVRSAIARVRALARGAAVDLESSPDAAERALARACASFERLGCEDVARPPEAIDSGIDWVVEE